MLLHEVLEKAATSLLIFRNVLFQCRYRHSAHVGYCEDSGNLRVQGEPFDVAVKFPREKERSFQCRVHEIMLFDRNENGLETHGNLQFERISSPGAHRWARPPTSRRFAHDWCQSDRPRGHANSQVSAKASSPIT